MIFLFLHISFAIKVPRFLCKDGAKIRRKIGIRKKNTIKLRRTLKFNGLCRLSWIKNDPVYFFLLKIFGVSIIICIFAALVPAEPLDKA
ncbi:hypothetical protein DW064_01430 [Segatella copri]|uniref:Uncharacterized protein n=1 Tax=Segatella copri TaxID=165179 RepID=A0AA92V7H7_9BACT|nr:hypothetical protein DW064_01430 [Segatella copri]